MSSRAFKSDSILPGVLPDFRGIFPVPSQSHGARQPLPQGALGIAEGTASARRER